MIVINHESRSGRKLDFKPGETIAEMIVRYKNDFGISFVGGSYKVQDTIVGRDIPPEETVVDEREYYLTAWLTPAGARNA